MSDGADTEREEREGLSNDKVCEILSGVRLDNLRNGWSWWFIVVRLGSPCCIMGFTQNEMALPTPAGQHTSFRKDPSFGTEERIIKNSHFQLSFTAFLFHNG